MSNRNSILLLDPSFDPVSATSCTLSVNMGIDNLSYSIIDNNDCRIYTVFDEHECEDTFKNFSERLQTDPYLKLPFASVKFLIYTESKIHVPAELFDETNLVAQSQFLPGSHSDNVYVYHQENFTVTTLFSLPQTIESLLLTHFPEAQMFTSVMTNPKMGAVFTINFTVGSFTLIYTKEDKLIFEQSYEISDIEEFTYYLLLITNQLMVDPKSTQVYLSGIVHEGDDRHICLSKYFSQVYFLTVDERLKQEILDDLPPHYYVNLLALHSCE